MFCFVLFTFGRYFVYFPPKMGRGLFLVFSITDFFSLASRIGHICRPYTLSHKDDKEITDFLLCSLGFVCHLVLLPLGLLVERA